MNTPTAPDAIPSGAPAGSHSHPLSPALADALRQALAGLPARPPRMAVAVSGGADSAMLALHAAAIAQEQGIDLL
ncbi:MAG: tRNA(Ile)-lysidine synthetase, partial [Achromobacter sp.]|nr:tRNA(Ile)-lysidine synthetase [Achromobacter sp.]